MYPYEKEYDFFISHASEDKQGFVRPLAEALTRAGFNIWYDEFSLKIGDSLFGGISEGIKNSRFGILVLSKNFFDKSWTKKELESLISKEVITNSNVILPVWLNLKVTDVYNYSPLLVDKLAISINDGDEIEKVVNKIQEKTQVGVTTSKMINDRINYILNCNKYERKKYLLDIETRIKNLYHFQEAIYNLDFDFAEEESDEEVLLYSIKLSELHKKYNIPEGVWYNDELELDSSMSDLIKLSKKWINRKLSYEEAYEFYFLMEEYLDIDFHFILYGYPHSSIKVGKAAKESHKGIFTVGVLKDIDKDEKRIIANIIWKKYYYDD